MGLRLESLQRVEASAEELWPQQQHERRNFIHILTYFQSGGNKSFQQNPSDDQKQGFQFQNNNHNF